MANIKVIAVAAAAIVLVSAVVICSSSYMSDFEMRDESVARIGAEPKTMETAQSPLLGSGTAPITIIEVGDYQCEMCKKWFEETRPKIIENYVETGKANFMFVDMPFLGTDSYFAAEATYCADDQGKYWEYHETLYKLQQHVDDGWANGARLVAIAQNLDMDVMEFNNCMTGREHHSTVDSQKHNAKNFFGANSTPTFLIVNVASGESEQIIGAHPYSSFEKVINSLL